MRLRYWGFTWMLAVGKGEPAIAVVRESEQQPFKVEVLPFSSIDFGHLQLRESVSIQASLLPSGHKKIEVIWVPGVSTFYLVDKDFAKPTDGIWITRRADVMRYAMRNVAENAGQSLAYRRCRLVC